MRRQWRAIVAGSELAYGPSVEAGVGRSEHKLRDAQAFTLEFLDRVLLLELRALLNLLISFQLQERQLLFHKLVEIAHIVLGSPSVACSGFLHQPHRRRTARSVRRGARN